MPFNPASKVTHLCVRYDLNYWYYIHFSPTSKLYFCTFWINGPVLWMNLVLKFSHRKFKRLLARRIRRTFVIMLWLRKHRGRLIFDHEKQTLDIDVQPQSDCSQQGDMRQLSGGERSFSTVCFILSLWREIQSPLRLVVKSLHVILSRSLSSLSNAKN